WTWRRWSKESDADPDFIPGHLITGVGVVLDAGRTAAMPLRSDERPDHAEDTAGHQDVAGDVDVEERNRVLADREGKDRTQRQQEDRGTDTHVLSSLVRKRPRGPRFVTLAPTRPLHAT